MVNWGKFDFKLALMKDIDLHKYSSDSDIETDYL